VTDDATGVDHFFHHSSVQGNFLTLVEGQSFAFTEERSDRGPRAIGVVPL
jgi:cold shock CspA family protein